MIDGNLLEEQLACVQAGDVRVKYPPCLVPCLLTRILPFLRAGCQESEIRLAAVRQGSRQGLSLGSHMLPTRIHAGFVV